MRGGKKGTGLRSRGGKSRKEEGKAGRMLSFPEERKGLGHGSGLATGDTATSWTAGRSHRGLSQGHLWKHPGAQHPSSSARRRLCAPRSWEQQGAEQGRKRGTLVSGKGVVITQPDYSPGGEKRLRQQLSPDVAAACKEGIEQSQAGSRAGRREHRGVLTGLCTPPTPQGIQTLAARDVCRGVLRTQTSPLSTSTTTKHPF